MLVLSREPAIAAVAARSAEKADSLSDRMVAVLARVEWPGKPGVASPVPALSSSEQRRFETGREVYASLCAACHQVDGRGRPDTAPSLVGSLLALGPADVTARVLINGKEGSTGLMPPLGASLSDDQIAAVLTYIRREWGQRGTPVEPAVVDNARRTSAGRTRPWTDDDLLAVIATRLPAATQ
jgi:mono/diheme cytochrome c family protein